MWCLGVPTKWNIAICCCFCCWWAFAIAAEGVQDASSSSTTQQQVGDASSVPIYDVLVLGSGPAGLTAALFAARAGLSVLVLGSDAGSSLSEALVLDNFPGFGSYLKDDNINEKNGPSAKEEEEDEFGGLAWLKLSKRKAMKAGANFAQAGLLASNLQSVSWLSQEENSGGGTSSIFQIDIDNIAPNSKNNHAQRPLHVHGRSVILAMGATGQKLGMDASLENELWGKSMHSCAVCDGSSYVDQIVVVVGGGDAAVDAALLLARYAKRVIVVHRRLEFRASHQQHVQMLQAMDNIQIATPFVIKEYHVVRRQQGDQKTQRQTILTGIRIQNTETNHEQNVRCDGIFVMIGSKPNTEWLLLKENNNNGSTKLGLQLDSNGYILLDKSQRNAYSKATAVAGIFVAGEATDQMYRQAITAAAEGAQAAMDAERWLRTQGYSTASKDARRTLSQQQQQQQAIPLQTIPRPTQDHQSLRGKSSDQEGAATGEQQRKAQEEEPGQQAPQQQRETPAITCDVAQVACLDQVVHEHPLVVFSTPRCPQCEALKETLALEGLSGDHPNVNIINVSKLGTSKVKKMRVTLKEMTGRKSFPAVFLGGKWIAGEAQTRIWQKEGKLREMLVEAKVYDVDEATTVVDDGQEEL